MESQVDLRGRLRIQIPEQITRRDAASPWTVSVDGNRGLLSPVAEEDDFAANDRLHAELAETSGVDKVELTDFAVRRYDVVSDNLTSGTMRLRLEGLLLVPSVTLINQQEFVEFIALPKPIADDVTLQSEVLVNMVGDLDRSIASAGADGATSLSYRVLPSVIPVRITSRPKSMGELVVDQVVIRSAISDASQHDQIIAETSGAGDFEIEFLGANPDVQVYVNEVSSVYTISQGKLIVAIDTEGENALVDVRLWSDLSPGTWTSSVAPLATVRSSSNQIYWDVSVPADRHLVWAPASANRSMRWEFQGWRMARRPLLSPTGLISQVGAVEASPMPTGTRYQFLAMDTRSFRIRMVSTTLVWLFVAGFVVVAGAIAVYFPKTRNPASFVVLILILSGVLCVAPDAVILLGQVSVLAIVLLAVMFALRSVMQPAPSRVLESTFEERVDPSTRVVGNKSEGSRPSVAIAPTVGESVAHASGEAAT